MTVRNDLTDADRRYVQAAIKALKDGAFLILWLTPRCPECGQIPREADGLHQVFVGHVLIGCEGYYAIDPNAVGIESEGWQDWTKTS